MDIIWNARKNGIIQICETYKLQILYIDFIYRYTLHRDK